MLALNKLDLMKEGALIERVPLRNTLLEILHPDVAVAIVHVDPATISPLPGRGRDREGVETALGRDLHGLRLDFASGGKKHGDFFFTDAEPRLA